MPMKRWVVGQDRTELIDVDGRVIHSLPRWTPQQIKACAVAIKRSSPRSVSDTSISRAVRQEYAPVEDCVARIGRVLSLVRRQP